MPSIKRLGANRRTVVEVIADIEKALALETAPEGKAQLERALKYWKEKSKKIEGEIR